MLQHSAVAEGTAITHASPGRVGIKSKSPETREPILNGSLRFFLTAMILFGVLLLAAGSLITSVYSTGSQEALGSTDEQAQYRKACPDYRHYAVIAQYVERLRYSAASLIFCQPTIQ